MRQWTGTASSALTVKIQSSCLRSSRWSLLWPCTILRRWGCAEVGGRRLLLLLVGAAGGDRGAVVVELVGGDLEAADGVENELGLKAGAIGLEEAVEGSAQAVVVEELLLVGIEPEEVGVPLGHPLAELVEGAAAFDDRAQEHAQRQCRGQRGARVGGQSALHELVDTQPKEEGVDDGQGAQGLAMELEAAARHACPNSLEYAYFRIRCRPPIGQTSRLRSSPAGVDPWPRSRRLACSAAAPCLLTAT